MEVCERLEMWGFFLETLEIFGNSEKAWGISLGHFGIEFRIGDCHPSVDRSCLIQGHGLSPGGNHMYRWKYFETQVYMYICMPSCDVHFARSLSCFPQNPTDGATRGTSWA